MSQTLTAPPAARTAPVRSAPVRSMTRVGRRSRDLAPRLRTRLTLRGRVLVVLVLALAGFALVSLGQIASNALAADQSAPASSVSTTEWVVQPSETLWQIAETVEPDTDPRDTVARIVLLNDLPDSSVVAGQTLLIPA